jgi:putative nucleotidyltransferase with HDIG domain
MAPVDDYIKKVGFLPPPPPIFAQLLSLLGKPNADLGELVQLVSFDPALTANLLRASNSAWMGLGMPIESVEQAVLRLGSNAISRMVITLSIRCVLEPLGATAHEEIGDFWKHSVTTAVAGELVAKDQGDDAALVFTAGLLHDLGKAILTLVAADTYKLLLEEVKRNQSCLLEAEKDTFGMDHAEIGARLFEVWHFPESLVTAVRFHHNPGSAGSYSKLAAYVYVADMIAYFMGHGYGFQCLSLRRRGEALDSLQLPLSVFGQYMGLTEENLPLIQSLLDAVCAKGTGSAERIDFFGGASNDTHFLSKSALSRFRR